MDRKLLEEQIAPLLICEYAWISVDEIPFLEQVRHICETECPRYGTTWACPPAVGTVEECQERCRKYAGAFLFTTMEEVEDIADFETVLKTRDAHEKITREVEQLLRKQSKDVLTLSTESCEICAKCAYPGAPCRHPELMYPCVESYGILVTELAENNNITFMGGGNIVVWFSLLFYK